MAHSKPYISVITSTFNCKDKLQRAIDSVRDQTFSDVEHIIIDGASEDGTVGLIQKNAEEEGSCISYWISEPDTGIYNAWNKALDQVRGKWIIFLGADDHYTSIDCFERLVPFLEKAEGAFDYVYGKFNLLDKAGNLLRVVGKDYNHVQNYPFTNLKKPPPHPSNFHHISLFEQESFDESFFIAADADFNIKALNFRGKKAFFVDIAFQNHYEGGLSTSAEYEVDFAREKKRLIKGNLSFISYHYYQLMNLLLNFKKFCRKLLGKI